MTRVLVERLKALEAKATKSPWFGWPFKDGGKVCAQPPADGEDPLCLADCDMDERVDYDTQSCANAAFIAETRNALPHLLSTLESLSEKVGRMEAENAEDLDIMAEFKAEIARLAESDPEISEQDRRRLAAQGAAARYREMALLSLTQNNLLRARAKTLKDALKFVVETRECNHHPAPDTSAAEYYANSCPICRARQALASPQPETGSEEAQ